jgi:hypothetical protein
MEQMQTSITTREDWSFSINQLFFYTYLDNPLLPENPSAQICISSLILRLYSY